MNCNARIISLILFLVLQTSFLFAQNPSHILPDKATCEIVKIALDHTYNFEPEASKKICDQIRKKYPNHPGPDFIMSLNIYWDMLHNDSYKEQAPIFIKYLTKTIDLSTKMLEKDKKDLEGIFFKLAAECYLTLYYSERNETSNTISYAKKLYSSIKIGMVLKSKLNEFYFPSGIYNYYVVMYPEVHPVFKPFMFLFLSGDKKKGLQEMDYAYNNTIFTKLECAYHLSNIYLKYEGTPLLAYEYTKIISHRFPKNLFFTLRHAEVLIERKEYAEAEKIALQLSKSGKNYFISASHVLYGKLYENYYKDSEKAAVHFQKAIDYSKLYTNPEVDYLSMAYAGMGRYYKKKGNKTKAVEYYKKCRAIAEYRTVIKEADLYLSGK